LIVAAAIPTIFAQPNQEAVRRQLVEVVRVMEPPWNRRGERQRRCWAGARMRR